MAAINPLRALACSAISLSMIRNKFWQAALSVMTPLLMTAPAFAGVPIEIAASGHATVPVEFVFGEKQFVLDTGAEGSAVYSDFAEAVGLDGVGSTELQGQTGALEVPLVRIGGLSLDGVRKGPIDAVKLPRRADGVRLAGIVGLDVIGDRTLVFDLPRHRVSLLPSGHRPSGVMGRATRASTIAGGLLTIPVKVGSWPSAEP
jgi:hypothetical protein